MDQHRSRQRLLDGETLYAVAKKQDMTYLVTAELADTDMDTVALRDEGVGVIVKQKKPNSEFNVGDR